MTETFHVPNNKIPGLDGLRAVAFLLVFGFHTGYVRFGWMGVQIFFVISGFLITDILLRMKDTLLRREYFLKFYARRFLRIFPLYYFFLIGLTGLALGSVSLQFKPGMMETLLDQMKFAFLYVFNFFSATNYYADLGILDHLWSLSVEEQFYIVWPLLILLMPRRYLKRFFAAGIFAGLFFRLLIFLLVGWEIFPFLRTSAPLVVYFMTFSHVDAFSFGAYISRFPLKRPRLVFWTLCLLVPLIGIGTHYAYSGTFESIRALGYDFLMPVSFQYLWAYSLLNCFFMFLIYVVVFERYFVRVLEFPPLPYLGRISYGLYVYHFPVIWLVRQGISEFDLPAGWQSAFVFFASAILTFLLAFLSYHLLEAPLLKLKDRFAYSR